jgi:hypothetical protein
LSGYASRSHDWLTGMRGGEKVLEALRRVFPTRSLTLVHAPARSRRSSSPTDSDVGRQSLPQPARFYRHYLPTFPP